ncbi:unnamed protein product [Victoria cruziana]
MGSACSGFRGLDQRERRRKGNGFARLRQVEREAAAARTLVLPFLLLACRVSSFIWHTAFYLSLSLSRSLSSELTRSSFIWFHLLLSPTPSCVTLHSYKTSRLDLSLPLPLSFALPLFISLSMERETNNRKRGREEQEAVEMVKCSRKKPSAESSEISQNSEDGGSFLKPLSVFEFPWQHDFIPSSHGEEEEQWKDSGSLFFPTPPSIFWDHAVLNGFGIAPAVAALDAEESPPAVGDDEDGTDCIWSSILSQPLFMESSSPRK